MLLPSVVVGWMLENFTASKYRLHNGDEYIKPFTALRLGNCSAFVSSVDFLQHLIRKNIEIELTSCKKLI